MRHYAVIGNPIAHSYSPLIHNANFKALGIEATYEKHLVESIQDIRMIALSEGWSGFNVTLPFKQAIIPMLDEVKVFNDIPSVNTIIVEDGKFIGRNTDIIGLADDLREKKIGLGPRKKVLVLGYGGLGVVVAEGVVPLKGGSREANLTVVNRTMKDGIDVQASIQEMMEMLPDYDVVINTLSIGALDDPGALQVIPKSFSGIFYDCTPKKTLIESWVNENTEGKAYNGLGMLVHQAALSFKIWFKQEAELEVMKKALEGIEI